ncbi:MAG: hypothetical protein WKG07_33945 [Hymenobacter sp.]
MARWLHHPLRRFLNDIYNAFERDNKLAHLLLDEQRGRASVQGAVPGVRAVVSAPPWRRAWPCRRTPAPLGYFEPFRTARLPSNLIQAQRDYFGAHTYELIGHGRRIPHPVDAAMRGQSGGPAGPGGQPGAPATPPDAQHQAIDTRSPLNTQLVHERSTKKIAADRVRHLWRHRRPERPQAGPGACIICTSKAGCPSTLPSLARAAPSSPTTTSGAGYWSDVNQFSRSGKADKDEQWQAFAPNIYYQAADVQDAKHLQGVSARKSRRTGAASGRRPANVIHYLAVAPNFFPIIAENLAKAGLTEDTESHAHRD